MIIKLSGNMLRFLLCQSFALLFMPIFAKAQAQDCYSFSIIVFEGNEAISSKKLYKIANKYIDRCLILEDIKESLIADILELYQKNGYILALPYFPDQNLADGSLEIVIKEGILQDVVYDAEVLSSISVKSAFWGQKNNALNMREIEKSLEILNGSGAYVVKMDVAPGEESGYSNLLLDGQRAKKYGGYITITNDYNTLDDTKFPKKEARVIIGGSIADLIINDSLSLSANSTLGEEKNKQAGSFSANYRLPLGSWTLSLGNTTDLLKNVQEQPNISITNRTNTFASYLELSKVLSRGQIYKLSGNIKLNAYNTANYVDGLKLTFSSYDVYYEDFGLDYNLFFDRYSFNVGFTYTHGQPLFGQEAIGKNPQEFEQNLFNMYGFTLNTTISFPEYKLSYGNNLITQYSNDVLYSFKDLSITGSGGVRGYEGVNYTWSSGFINQNDITYRIWDFENPYIASISAMFAIDFGAPIEEYSWRMLTSKGIPLFAWYTELKTSGKVSGSIGYGRPIIKEEFVDKNQQVIRFSLGYNF
jgi:hemolysin activation/secretion protein